MFSEDVASLSLVGMSIVLVGGAGLIGQALVAAVARSGGTPIVVDPDRDALAKVESEFRTAGITGFTLPMAVENKSGAVSLMEAVGNVSEHIHGLVVCAYPGRTRKGDTGQVDFRERLAAHAGLFFDLNDVFGAHFRTGHGGSVVNTSSIYGANAPRFGLYAGTEMTVPPDYIAAKAAVNALTRYFAAAFAEDGVRFNAVAPGGIADNQPASFQSAYAAMCGTIGLLSPQHLTGLVVYLLSDAARAVTGQVITIDDGWSL